MRILVNLWVMVLALVASSGLAHAQATSIIVPFGPGGVSDLLARRIAEGLATQLGRPVIVENKPGAQGIMGAQFVARSAPDGKRAILMSNSLSSIEFLLQPDAGLDTVRDFAPICVVARFPSAFIISATLPFKTFREFVEAARKAPGKYTYAHASAVMKLNAEAIAKQEGIELVGVPYKSLGEGMTDVIAGRVDITINDVNSALPYIKDNKVRPLMMTTKARYPLYPQIPSAAESGVGGMDVYSNMAVFMPKDSPERTRTEFTDALAKVLEQPAIVKQIADFGYELVGACGPAAADYVRRDVAEWRQRLGK